MNQDHEPFLREAIRLSEQALTRGDEPYGALLVVDGQVVLRACNTTLTRHDITAHAELNLVREAWKTLPPETLQKATLYASAEPCPMCAGAIYWAGIPTVIFGCGVELNAEITAQDIAVPSRDVLLRGGRRIEVVGPLLEDEAAAPVRRSRGAAKD